MHKNAYLEPLNGTLPLALEKLWPKIGIYQTFKIFKSLTLKTFRPFKSNKYFNYFTIYNFI